MRTFFASALLAATATFAFASDSEYPKDMPVIKIDLDLEPRLRFKDSAIYFHDTIEKDARRILKWVPQFLVNFADSMAVLWERAQPEPYQEILGMCEELEGLTMGECIFVNMIYDIESFCSAIIAKQTDGTIIHGRMMDFEATGMMKGLVYRGEYYRNGEPLFHSVMFGLTTGVYTGSKPGAFNVSLNQRYPQHNFPKRMQNVAMTFFGYDMIGWVNRRALEQCDDYDCAYQMITKTPVSSKSYISLSGIQGNEGVVITRDNFGVAHVDHLSKDNWYLVQTNRDHWDQGCNTRCAALTEHIEEIGHENFDLDALYNVLNMEPNLNEESLYAAAFSAQMENSPFFCQLVEGSIPFVQ